MSRTFRPCQYKPIELQEFSATLNLDNSLFPFLVWRRIFILPESEDPPMMQHRENERQSRKIAPQKSDGPP